MVLKKKVRETIIKHQMIASGETVLVALSGGADSVCLLKVLDELSSEFGIQNLSAAHLNHGLRKTAKRDMDFCENLCRSMNIPFFKKEVDIRKLSEELSTCEEDAGRIARYAFFNELREKHGFNKIATAHNMNDQTETLLMRVLSGSSLDGLSAIKPVREDGVIRPLINVKRCHIEKYLDKMNCEYMIDETNLSDAYKRNSIRLFFIPLIEEKYNPNFIETASAMAEDLTRDAEYIEKKAKEISDSFVFPASLEDLIQTDDAIVLRVLASACNTTFSKNAKDSLIAFLKKGRTGTSFPVNKSSYLYIEYQKLYLKEYQEINDYCYTLHPGSNYIKEIDAEFIVSEGEGCGKNTLNVPDISSLTVRNRRNGDRIYIKNINGSKKLKDIFIDRKIPKDHRNIWPVVLLGEEIIWLTGIYKNENENKKYNIKVKWRQNNV